jgi:hypothetical protein
MRPFVEIDGKKRELASASYIDEKEIQTLVASNPEILPIIEVNAAFAGSRTVGRECPTDAGPIDVLLMNPEGRITLVETKLASNPEQARKVVGQCLHYLVDLPASFDAYEAYYRKFVGDSSASLFEAVCGKDSELNEEDFRIEVEKNLATRDILVLIVGDKVKHPDRLLAMLGEREGQIRGLRAKFGVMALHKYVCDNDVRVIVPVVYGKMVTAQRMEIRVEMVADGVALPTRVLSTKSAVDGTVDSGSKQAASKAKSALDPDSFRERLATSGVADVSDAFLSAPPEGVTVAYHTAMAVVRASVAGLDLPILYVDSRAQVVRISPNTAKVLNRQESADLSPLLRFQSAFCAAFPEAKRVKDPRGEAFSTLSVPLTPGAGAKLRVLAIGLVDDLRATFAAAM